MCYNIYILKITYKGEIKMRKFRMYFVDVSNDCSEFELRFEFNGEVVDKKIEYSVDDILFESYNFFYRNCEKYGFDSRFDRLDIELNYRMGM